ncbi:MAG TPA: O-antigen ligase family protein [Dehalococcoidia bacterium]|nr:O-antigen ligase family protein [Dehalococcoidia bacterium]
MIDRAIARLPQATPLAALKIPVAAALLLVVLALLATGVGGAELLAGLTALLIVLAAAVLDRRLLVPLIIVALPLEIWEELSPIQFDGSSLVDRLGRSTVLNAGRMAIIALGVYWLLTARSRWEERLPRSGLLVPAFAVGILYVLGSLYSRDTEQGLIFTVTMALHLALLVMIPVFVADRQTLWLCVWAFIGVMWILAFVGIYLQVTDTFLWNPDLGFDDTPRINTTFLDPNIYARVLVIAMVLTIVASFQLPQEWRLAFIAAVLAPCALALIFTNSRSGWLVAAMALLVMIALTPIRPRARAAALTAAAIGALAAAAVGEVVFDAKFLDRLQTLTEGSEALGAREYLIDAAWAMFRDHPVFGLGLGSFQEAFLGPYSHYNLNPELGVSLSHTEVLTILAELGIVGAIIVAFLFVRYGALVVNLYRAASLGDRALAAGFGVSVLVIFVSSQAEARLLNDPYLWLMFGLTLALEGILRRERGLDPPLPDEA